MSIKYNNTSATIVKYNNTELDKVVYNTTTVYQRIIVNYYCENSIYRSVKVISGNSVDLSSNNAASKSGWSFIGWRTDKTANGTVQSSITAGTSTINLYAVYRQTITLTYNGNGATSGSTASQSGYRYYNNGNIINPSFALRSNGFTRTNYRFVNWRMGSASGTAYNVGSSVTLSNNTTFYAYWQEVFTGYLYNRGNEYTTFTGGWNDSGTSMHGSVPESGSIQKASSYIQINVSTSSRYSKTLVTANRIDISNYNYITFTFSDRNGKTIRRVTNPISYYKVLAYVFCGLDHDGNGIFYGIADTRYLVQNRCDQGYYLYNWVKDTGTGDSNYAEDHSYIRLVSVQLT